MSLCDLEVDYFGFIIDYQASPRYIEMCEAVEMIKEVKLRRPDLQCVAVLVDPNEVFIESVLQAGCFDILQLHGQESPEFCEGLLGRGVEIWKACVVKEAGDVDKLDVYRGKVDKLLVDGGRGEGKKVPLEILKGVKFDIIAGGLNAENLLEVVEVLSPEIVDLNSGVESSPGMKSRQKVEATIKVLEALA